MTPSANDWVDLYAAELGIPAPTEEELNELLSLAGVAAHASERQAAPVSCWLAAKAGLEPGDALLVGQRLAKRFNEQDG